MNIALSVAELLQITGGEARGVSPRDRFSAVAVESSAVRGGELFVALHDSRAAEEEAHARGAAFSLASASGRGPQRGIAVADVAAAFFALSAWWRKGFAGSVTAIAGTNRNAVTTVASLTAAMLLKSGPGSFLADAGRGVMHVLHSICSMNSAHAWAVLELCPAALNELLACAAPDLLVLPAGEAASLRERAEAAACPLLFPGSDPPAYVVEAVALRGFDGISLDMRLGEEAIVLQIPLLGRHNAAHAALAAAAARRTVPGLTGEQLAAACARFSPLPGRLSPRHTAAGRTVIDASHYADSESFPLLLDLAEETASSPLFVFSTAADAGWAQAGAAERLAALRPAAVVLVGPCGDQLLAPRRTAGLRLFPAGRGTIPPHAP